MTLPALPTWWWRTLAIPNCSPSRPIASCTVGLPLCTTPSRLNTRPDNAIAGKISRRISGQISTATEF